MVAEAVLYAIIGVQSWQHIYSFWVNWVVHYAVIQCMPERTHARKKKKKKKYKLERKTRKTRQHEDHKIGLLISD